MIDLHVIHADGQEADVTVNPGYSVYFLKMTVANAFGTDTNKTLVSLPDGTTMKRRRKVESYMLQSGDVIYSRVR